MRCTAWKFLALAAIMGAGCVTVAPSPAPSLNTLDRPMDFRAMCESSYDRNWENGNGDARPIPPGQTLTLGELKGPGRIAHIWFTIAAQDPAYPRSMVLRMYWDGEEQPGVEAPIGDFFAVGHGIRKDLISSPVAISSEGRAYHCYWPMPFRKSVRITVSNDSEKPVDALYYIIDWQQLPELPANTPYFHAQYRQETPCGEDDYLILDAEGQGHFVGTVLSVREREKSWFGEGDERFYIDGETVPSINGTGTEDYFGDAWGFREINRPSYGVSLWEGYEIGDHGTAYRWHLQDPVPFKKSLKVTIEHKGVLFDEKGNVTTGFGLRHDDFYSVAFWYQTGRAKRFAEIPPMAERLPKCARIEIEQLLPAPPPGASMQDIGECSGGKQILFQNADPKGRIDIPFEIAEAKPYLMSVGVLKSWDYGIFDVLIDGQPAAANQDLYNPTVAAKEIRLGVRKLDAGKHTLTFQCRGNNPNARIKDSQAPGYFLGADVIILREY